MVTKHIISQLQAYELNACIIHQHGQIKYLYEKEPGASNEVLPVNSCTKSVLSALICIAMEQGRFPSPEERASTYFPYLLNDPKDKLRRKPKITIEHLLTLSAGFQWTEFGGTQSFPKMSRSPNWIEFAVKQPMANEPGTKWSYNSGVSQMLAEILRQSIGMPISAFALKYLFAPLGIDEYEWKCDPQGTHTGGFGLSMTAHHLLSFGLLYLQKGMWNGKQLISKALIERAITPAIEATPPERGFYGWHWWVDDVTVNEQTIDYFYARGFGGQFVFVVPELDAAVVTTRERNKRGYFPHDLFRDELIKLLI